jgi:hypothetical protein
MFAKDNLPSSQPLWGGGMRNSSSSGMLSAASNSAALGATGTAFLGDKPPLCKYFINGGCLRGEQCQYLHELPDERHLDVNGVGFILHSGVHNAQKSVAPPGRKRRPMPRYRPPEPFLEHNLPPALAIPFSTATTDVLQGLLRSMLDGR